MVVSQEKTQGVAWWAHIGGFVYGVVAVWLFRKPVDPLRVKAILES
jgi:membrane associated rhomboid family serine protease